MMRRESARIGPSDETLIAEIQRGNSDAYDRLATRYQRKLRRFIQGLVIDKGLANDILEEVLLRAYRTINEVHRGVNPSTWLYSIARRVAAQRIGTQDPRAARFQSYAEPSDVSAATAASRLRYALERALAELDVDERSAFVLSEMHGLERSEVADVLETSTWQAYRRLASATSKLRRKLAALDPALHVSRSELREQAAAIAQRTGDAEPDIVARVLAALGLSAPPRTPLRSQATLDERDAADTIEFSTRVVFEARRSAYPGSSPPWQPVSSRFANRRLPDADERKQSRAGYGRYVVEIEVEEDVYYEVVEENLLDLLVEDAGYAKQRREGYGYLRVGSRWHRRTGRRICRRLSRPVPHHWFCLESWRALLENHSRIGQEY